MPALTVLKAVNQKGEGVEFFNVTMDGHGCQGQLKVTSVLTRSKTCFIKGVRFRAVESYLGGIILIKS